MVFTRSIAKSTIYVSEVKVENGEIVSSPLAAIDVIGVKVTTKNAMKFAKKHYGKGLNLIVTDITVSEAKYEIDLCDFLEYARVIEETDPVSIMDAVSSIQITELS